MKITKAILKKIIAKLEKLEEEIDRIGMDCDQKSGKSELGDALWSAQSDIESAKTTLDDAVNN